jgi:hypothetical protein
VCQTPNHCRDGRAVQGGGFRCRSSSEGVSSNLTFDNRIQCMTRKVMILKSGWRTSFWTAQVPRSHFLLPRNVGGAHRFGVFEQSCSKTSLRVSAAANLYKFDFVPHSALQLEESRSIKQGAPPPKDAGVTGPRPLEAPVCRLILG